MTYIVKKKIIVNATALDKGGALTILKQFIFHAGNSKNEYLIFTPKNIELQHNENIKIIPTDKKNWCRRIIWDSFGLSKFLVKNKINYDTIISLQNTSIRINKEKKQYIYIHQSIPFSEIKVKYNSFDDIKLFLYKNFYSYFMIAYHHSNSRYVVQTNWMKESLKKKWPKIMNDHNIIVISPDHEIYSPPSIYNSEKKENNNFKILYPASPFKYKNHLIILRAIHLMKKDPILNGEIKFLVTFNKGEYKKFDDLSSLLKLNDNVEYLGFISRESLACYYLDADCIVFPSYIETFGLPLSEAAYLNKKIIASDLAYARDTLEGYNNVSYSKYDSAYDWKDKILKAYHDYAPIPKETKPFLTDKKNVQSWSYLFNLLSKSNNP